MNVWLEHIDAPDAPRLSRPLARVGTQKAWVKMSGGFEAGFKLKDGKCGTAACGWSHLRLSPESLHAVREMSHHGPLCPLRAI